MTVLTCTRELELAMSADEVWTWLSDVRNVMTANQFHASVECGEADARNPRAGLVIPIRHEIPEFPHVRHARITKFVDYEIAWGERLDDAFGFDTFPHSEGWTVEPLGPGRCMLRNHLRGRFNTAVGELIGEHAWNAVIPVILDNDLQDVALAVGAIDEREEIDFPMTAFSLLRLANASEIDGVPAGEYLGITPVAMPDV